MLSTLIYRYTIGMFAYNRQKFVKYEGKMPTILGTVGLLFLQANSLVYQGKIAFNFSVYKIQS